jgi:hypothetical protein
MLDLWYIDDLPLRVVFEVLPEKRVDEKGSRSV